MSPVIILVAIIWTVKVESQSATEEDNVVESFENENCKTYSMNQSVSAPGCQKKYIENKACYGQCYSKSGIIGGLITCKACWPTKIHNKNVALDCDNGQKKIVKVAIVMYCQCRQRRCPSNINKIAVATTTKTTQVPKEEVDVKKKQTRDARRIARMQQNEEKVRTQLKLSRQF